jgi:acetyltransferase-like isoleucine patch superfamily enzyme
MIARLSGARLGKGVVIVGELRTKKKSGATLIIGDGVSIYSSPVANEVIGRRYTTLWAMATGAVLELERNVGVSSACICAAKEIRIGEGTIIGADAMILDNDFHLPAPNWLWGNAAAGTAKAVRIGRGCFIGTRAVVLKGVTIGDGAVIGAGAVVTCDVPAEHLAFGNPAQVRPLPDKWRRAE